MTSVSATVAADSPETCRLGTPSLLGGREHIHAGDMLLLQTSSNQSLGEQSLGDIGRVKQRLDWI